MYRPICWAGNQAIKVKISQQDPVSTNGCFKCHVKQYEVKTLNWDLFALRSNNAVNRQCMIKVHINTRPNYLQSIRIVPFCYWQSKKMVAYLQCMKSYYLRPTFHQIIRNWMKEVNITDESTTSTGNACANLKLNRTANHLAGSNTIEPTRMASLNTETGT